MKRNVYLNAIELQEVKNILLTLLKDINYLPKTEVINVKNALHRSSFSSLYAITSSPSYNASAMDGVALKAEKTYLASETNPITLKPNEYQLINTGNVLPNDFNAVLMIEDVIENRDKTITTIKSLRRFENVRPIGEDITKGDIIIPKNHCIRPIDISALLSAGHETIEVKKKITVHILPTGDEIVTSPTQLSKGNIVDSNSHYVKNALIELRCDASILPVQKDNFEQLEKSILEATLQTDILLVGAGSSAGSKDFVKAIVEKNGKVYAHGINMKPGKPVVIGTINNTPVIGLPGYPVSTYIAFEQVVVPLIHLMQESSEKKQEKATATLVQKVYSSLKNHEFVRVALGEIGNKLIALPLSRKAGVTMSLVKADGILKVPKQSEGYNRGESVEIMITNHFEPKKRLIVIGSHDILFDMIQDELASHEVTLISNHVGSFGGVMAMKNRECHISPVHLLGTNGVYNMHLIKEYLNNEYVLVRGVKRVQGLYVKKGNPKNIQTIQDLCNVVFVNRQRGSGTRQLLDHLLEKNKINTTSITGYDFELSNHIMVAESVKDERFDAGMGVESVAKISGVDFIKIGEESYDFIVHKDFLQDPKYQLFIDILQSEKFQQRMKELGGYHFKDTGTIID